MSLRIVLNTPSPRPSSLLPPRPSLQSSLTKLRKEHAVLKSVVASSGTLSASSSLDLTAISNEQTASSQATVQRLMATLTNLQTEHADLQDHYSMVSTEIARLTRRVIIHPLVCGVIWKVG